MFCWRSECVSPLFVKQVDTLSVKDRNPPFSSRFVQRLETDIRLGHIFPTNSFIRGMNDNLSPIRHAWAAHLKYSFQFRDGTWESRIFNGAYQGAGLGYYSFEDAREIGSPVALYLFQGARLARFSPRMSLLYEWNFGLSLGWKPYGEHNLNNIMIGSKLNAYINVNFYLEWLLSSRFNLSAGLAVTHFSNGNTTFPNAGMNLMGLKLGLAYRLDRQGAETAGRPAVSPVPEFPRHVSYDFVLFGSWRRKGYFDGESFLPSGKAYTVLGTNVAALYHVCYKFRAGLALDAVYDASANAFVLNDPEGSGRFLKPPLTAQMALGISGRLEYVMPYFIVGIGMGTNVLQRGGDLKAFYQILLLKVSVTRNTFIHIGYNLQEFKTPNYLMLGIGFRLNNRYPLLHGRK